LEQTKKFTVESVGPRIEKFLNSLLAAAGIEATPKVSEPEARFPDFENPDILVSFKGRDVDLLLENRAELLLALEHLTMESLRVAPHEHAMIIFDAHDYRMLRIEELRLTATTAAEKVLRSRQPFRFGPMTSRERRILHLALRDVAGIRSESLGSGPHRSVVVYPEGMPSLPEPPPRPRGPRRY
jgi:spoIIIJ-associated protein